MSDDLILAVVVRYKTALKDSATMQGFQRAFAEAPSLAHHFRVLVWDNSDDATDESYPGVPYSYVHAAENGGVSGAYNGALEYAEKAGLEWLLLLDQDTQVHTAFLQNIVARITDPLPQRVGVVVPTVMVGTVVVSPLIRRYCRRPAEYRDTGPRLLEGEALVINSGCVVRRKALLEIGGFSSAFWLDFADVYVQHQLFVHGFQVWWETDAVLQHEMTAFDYDNLMTVQRYRSLLQAEEAFNDLYRDRFESFVMNLALASRAWRQYRTHKESTYARMSLSAWWRRLSTSRSQRMKDWQSLQKSK